MLKSLKNPEFVNEIFKIIDEDVKDRYSEHGGIILIHKNLSLELKVIQDKYAKNKDEINNSSYELQDWADAIPHMAEFHLHAMSYNEERFAGPGKLDLIGPNNLIDVIGKANEFVITSLSKDEFNIDYFGGEKLISEKAKIIDLGNYKYSLQK